MKITMLHNGYDSLTLSAEFKENTFDLALSVGDATAVQDIIDLAHEIASLTREAWEAGKRGESFELEQIDESAL